MCRGGERRKFQVFFISHSQQKDKTKREVFVT